MSRLLLFTRGERFLKKRIYSSGLTNYNLENQRMFAELEPTLKSFLLTLDQPICLVAHNGTNFDFPLLKAELDEAGVSWEELQLLTCDSLEAFRFILPNFPGGLLDDSNGETDEHGDSQGTSIQPETENEACTSPKNVCFTDTPDPSSQDNGLKTPPRSQQPPKPNHPPPAPLKRKAIGRVYEMGADGRRHEKSTSYKLSAIYKRYEAHWFFETLVRVLDPDNKWSNHSILKLRNRSRITYLTSWFFFLGFIETLPWYVIMHWPIARCYSSAVLSFDASCSSSSRSGEVISTLWSRCGLGKLVKVPWRRGLGKFSPGRRGKFLQ